jgi:hypothetical protein
MYKKYLWTWKYCKYTRCSIGNFIYFWYNFEALKYNFWIYQKWEFLHLIMYSLNIAIIQLHSKSSENYKFHKKIMNILLKVTGE